MQMSKMLDLLHCALFWQSETHSKPLFGYNENFFPSIQRRRDIKDQQWKKQEEGKITVEKMLYTKEVHLHWNESIVMVFPLFVDYCIFFLPFNAANTSEYGFSV